jgi:ketosteroid isomerase-like protein
MLSWLTMRVVSYVMSHTRRGDVRPTLMLDADDVVLRFPGDNSWAGEFHGKEEHRRWLERFARVGLQIFPDQVAVSGWPWKMSIVIRGHDHLHAPDGQLVYQNRYVIWGITRWGRMKELEVYEDTEKAGAFDRWLERNEPRLGAVA